MIFFRDLHAKVDVGTPVAIYWVKNGGKYEKDSIYPFYSIYHFIDFF